MLGIVGTLWKLVTLPVRLVLLPFKILSAIVSIVIYAVVFALVVALLVLFVL